MLELYQGDNTSILPILGRKYALIYIDPPFNTGQKRTSARDKTISYNDSFVDYEAFIKPSLILARDLLEDTGSFFFHVDFREVHYCKVLLDTIFGRDQFRNEIIWHYDYGGRPKNCWPKKHDNILWYTKSNNYIFNFQAMDRLPYMAPGLVGPKKAALGKTPTDVWWNTIVPTQGKERTGYPTQKPLAILKRIVKIHSNQDDWCMDFFAGSGSFGEACSLHRRNCTLVDNNPAAIDIMERRLSVKCQKI